MNEVGQFYQDRYYREEIDRLNTELEALTREFNDCQMALGSGSLLSLQRKWDARKKGEALKSLLAVVDELIAAEVINEGMLMGRVGEVIAKARSNEGGE